MKKPWKKMQIAYFGYDLLIDCIKQIYNEGCQIIKIYSFPCDTAIENNQKLKEFARANKILYTEKRVTEKELSELCSRNCNLLLSAGYAYKIPLTQNTDYKAINIHPSLLPQGRGPWPIPYAIFHDYKFSGLTIHKLSDDLDAGDILLQSIIPIEEDETTSSYIKKIQRKAPSLLVHCLENLEELWNEAIPQNGGEHWQDIEKLFQPVKLEDRTAVERIRKKYGYSLAATSFSTLYCWQGVLGLSIYLEEDFYVVKDSNCESGHYYFPCGNPKRVLAFIRSVENPVWHFMEEKNVIFLNQNFPNTYTIKRDDPNGEYIALMTEQAMHSGGKFRHIRKQINQFKRVHIITVEGLSKENIDRARMVVLKWNAQTGGRLFYYHGDSKPCLIALNNMEKLGFSGVLIREGEQDIGLLLGNPVLKDMFDLNYAKCILKENGADYYCKQLFCEQIKNQYKYLNMEEDMGIEGLRMHKQQMQPVRIEPVYLGYECRERW